MPAPSPLSFSVIGLGKGSGGCRNHLGRQVGSCVLRLAKALMRNHPGAALTVWSCPTSPELPACTFMRVKGNLSCVLACHSEHGVSNTGLSWLFQKQRLCHLSEPGIQGQGPFAAGCSSAMGSPEEALKQGKVNVGRAGSLLGPRAAKAQGENQELKAPGPGSAPMLRAPGCPLVTGFPQPLHSAPHGRSQFVVLPMQTLKDPVSLFSYWL
nr:uncharacterized protein LOC105862307 [Microcebus murinus]